MPNTIAELQRRMEAAAAAMDFEEARKLRDRINLMRGGASGEDAGEADTAGLTRQRPGSMGLATSQQRMTPPPGWTPPPKPDPMPATPLGKEPGLRGGIGRTVDADRTWLTGGQIRE